MKEVFSYMNHRTYKPNLDACVVAKIIMQQNMEREAIEDGYDY